MLIEQGNDLNHVWDAVKHELHRGALDRKHPFRFVVLGTFGESGPDTRYVVLRKVDQELSFFIYTDGRTAKAKSLDLNPRISLLFYHPQKRVQLRVQAEVSLHKGDDLAKEHWSRVQGEGRKAYQSVLEPGSEIKQPEEAFAWFEDESDASNFLVLKIVPSAIEVLQLNGLEHLRAKFFREEGEWRGVWLAP